jgi:hypothetical protein
MPSQNREQASNKVYFKFISVIIDKEGQFILIEE